MASKVRAARVGLRVSVIPAPRPSPETPASGRASGGDDTGWQRRFAMRAKISDVAILVCGAAAGVFGGFGDDASLDSGPVSLVLGVVCVLGVWAALGVFRCWDRSVLGHGSEEFNRLLRAFASSAVLLGLAGLALKVQSVRPWVFAVIPAAGVAALLVRYALRRRLHRERRQGRQMRSVLAVGSPEAVRELVARTRRVPECGWHIAAACTPTGLDRADSQIGTPVVGDLDAVARVAIEGGFGVVAVSPAAGWTPKRLQQLSWDLEGSGAELVVDPGLMEIAGPRLHMTPVDGLQLLRLTNPRFTGLPGAFKGIADRVAAATAIMLLAPVFLLIAMVVRLDGGPAFFVQTRVGRGGKTFRMVKFRSMVVDAEVHLAALQASNQGAGPLFKMRRDPRVTRVGAVLRRYSLDELPQLFNVLLGTMSIVGPRPPLPGEVSGYEREARRKLMVKPGITGLWQVSGRSELSWEDSVRLDLRYVENWSPAMDIAIVWKTVRAMVRGTGAY